MLRLLLLLFATGVPVTYGVSCPYGWLQYGGLCYKYLGLQSFTNGVAACKQLGGRLFEPRSQALNYFLSIISGNRESWIGIKDNRYVSDGELIVYSRPYYTAGYGYVRYQSWYSEDCPDRMKAIYCELPSTNTDCGSPATIYVEDSFPSTSNSACMAACAATEGCVFWIYIGGQCGLKFFEAGDVAGGAGVAAQYPSQTYTGFPHYIIPQLERVIVGRLEKQVYTAADCQKMCAEDPKCNTFTWTNIDYNFGGVNSYTCIFNYGKSTNTLVLSGSTANNNIISGPACCYEKSACERPKGVQADVSVTTSGYHIASVDLEKYQKEQTKYMKSLKDGKMFPSNMTTTDEDPIGDRSGFEVLSGHWSADLTEEE